MAADPEVSGDRVTLPALVRGALAGARSSQRLAKGPWNLATLRPPSAKRAIGALLQRQAERPSRKPPPPSSTFKYRTVDPGRQGFDPAQVSDPRYVRCSAAGGYPPLTDEHVQALNAGQWRG